MKIGILTFHAAHNYGSMLQNYALQQILIRLGHEPETINLRTSIQKEIYNFFEKFSKIQDKKHIVRKMIFYPWKRSLQIKYNLFENFLSKELKLSEEINDSGIISSLPLYDAYIIGSDQCWNVDADDFDWSYFLGFAPENARRLSYAISMGPNPKAAFEVQKGIEERVLRELNHFDGISVRDVDTKNIVGEISNNNLVADIHVDPTLLLSKKEWEEKAGTIPIIKKPYVFFYNPYWISDVFQQAYEFGKLTGLPVVSSVPNMLGLIKYPSFVNVFETGPWEFLNLVKNAEYIIGRSFHLMVFSIIFQKKFVAINGLGDSRIKQLLTATNLEKCASEDGNLKDVLDNIQELDFSFSENWLEQEYLKSTDWLCAKLECQR